MAISATAGAAGTPVGTIIQNTATVDFDLAGTPITLQSNTTTITVVERIDVVVTLQSPQVLVAPNESDRALLFTVTNTGNGSETFSLAIDSILAGDDFNPTPSATPIYFDTDGSGDLNVGDQPYTLGVNDPVLAADATVDILIVNDIPGTVVNGNIGFSQLTASSLTGTGTPGTEFAGLGDGGVDAVIGTTGGEASGIGEYLVSDVAVSVVKSQVVTDPNGGTQPIPGATITYTVTVEVTSAGTTTASVLRDPIPVYTTYVANSMTLNAVAISDAIDADAGELDTSGPATVVMRLGDLSQADGVQTVVFDVRID
ncbi:MAG: hypothetical protein OEM51_03110 [Gammaproteobacteria bacterium]|nr:hypothetical protein [Gammaproteobacteria bacterium]MDH3431203.1 hypothetical protein [Gammaproteobacteria bacterium]